MKILKEMKTSFHTHVELFKGIFPTKKKANGTGNEETDEFINSYFHSENVGNVGVANSSLPGYAKVFVQISVKLLFVI